MKRKVKFRAWDKENKRMISVWEAEWNNLGEIMLINNKKAENFILMQYTGLKDGNGKEIYEGDIIEGNYDLGYANPKIRGCVEFDPSTGKYCIVPMSKIYRDTIPLERITNPIIIGNIHESDLKTRISFRD